MLVQVTLLVLLVTWMVYQKWQRRKFTKLFEQFNPNELWLPFVGHAYLFAGTNEDRMNRFKHIGEKSYDRGGVISLWQGNRLYLLISDPVRAKVILKNCLDKDDVYNLLQSVIGNGSLIAPVPIWRPRRRNVAPVFSQKSLNQFMPIFDRQSSILTNQLKDGVGKTFSIWKYITSYSLDSICESTLGLKLGSQNHPDKPFIQALGEVLRVSSERLCQPWLHSDVVHKALPRYKQYYKYAQYLFDYVNQIIEPKMNLLKNVEDCKPQYDEEKNQAPEKKPELKTMLQMLLESSGFDSVELQQEMLVVVFAGTDTSAVGIAFTALMLAAHPRVQDTCFDELQEIFGDSDRPVTVEDLPHLKYLELVIKETMRLYPPVPFVLRKVEKELVLPCGTTLIPGCSIAVSIFAVHRNPNYWGADAEQFRPERFIELGADHTAAYMPFSYGARGCVGNIYAMMSMKTALATLLRRYLVLPAEPQTCTKKQANKPIRLQFDIMLRDVENFEIKLELRK